MQRVSLRGGDCFRGSQHSSRCRYRKEATALASFTHPHGRSLCRPAPSSVTLPLACLQIASDGSRYMSLFSSSPHSSFRSMQLFAHPWHCFYWVRSWGTGDRGTSVASALFQANPIQRNFADAPWDSSITLAES